MGWIPQLAPAIEGAVCAPLPVSADSLSERSSSSDRTARVGWTSVEAHRLQTCIADRPTSGEVMEGAPRVPVRRGSARPQNGPAVQAPRRRPRPRRSMTAGVRRTRRNRAGGHLTTGSGSLSRPRSRSHTPRRGGCDGEQRLGCRKAGAKPGSPGSGRTPESAPQIAPRPRPTFERPNHRPHRGR